MEEGWNLNKYPLLLAFYISFADICGISWKLNKYPILLTFYVSLDIFGISYLTIGTGYTQTNLGHR